ncbi:MAG: RNA methyltransferase [Lachnospiraceae bacterium]|nr:RNA methyltransferase [Lachnospiraceae bacterium]
MISSTSNKKIKDVVLLTKKTSLRRERGLFVVEGIKMFMEIPDEDLEEVFASESFYNTCPTEAKIKMRTVPHEIVTDTVYAYMSDTRTPQGIMAIVKMRQHAKLSGNAFLILDRIQDPGNLGTIMRTAEAAGIDGILMNNETVDIYNPKVVRSTMGAVFRVPFVYTDNLPVAMKELGAVVYAAHLDGENDYDAEDYTGPTAFIIGNESSGISDEVAAYADKLIRIPMKGKVESLNAGVAASVLMFELARQRR